MNAVVVKERPILFSGPMVRAILDGRKTQTRRIVKPQPPEHAIEVFDWRAPHIAESVKANEGCYYNDMDGLHFLAKCPYGTVGSALWVRETYQVYRDQKFYRASSEGVGAKWIPSIFMRRADSRITLEITGVRVERLNEITPSDACAEGVFEDGNYATEPPLPYPVATFKKLWQSINGPESWEKNPWVWVVEFKRIER